MATSNTHSAAVAWVNASQNCSDLPVIEDGDFYHAIPYLAMPNTRASPIFSVGPLDSFPAKDGGPPRVRMFDTYESLAQKPEGSFLRMDARMGTEFYSVGNFRLPLDARSRHVVPAQGVRG